MKKVTFLRKAFWGVLCLGAMGFGFADTNATSMSLANTPSVQLQAWLNQTNNPGSVLNTCQMQAKKQWSLEQGIVGQFDENQFNVLILRCLYGDAAVNQSLCLDGSSDCTPSSLLIPTQSQLNQATQSPSRASGNSLASSLYQ